MAIKKQLAEQVLRKLSGGNVMPDRQIDIREIMLDMDQLRDEYVKLSYYNNIKNGHHTVDQEFLSLYQSIAVSYTSGIGYNFDLPVKPLALPRNVGIHSLYETYQDEQIIIIDALQTSALKGKTALGVTGKNYAYFQNGKGIFAGSISNITSWFLPSTYELLAMANNLHANGLGNFNTAPGGNVYWSSTETLPPSTTAMSVDFAVAPYAPTGELKTESRQVRAIRTFNAPVGTYSVGDLYDGYYIFYIDGTTYYQAYSEDTNSGIGLAWSNITALEVTTAPAIGAGTTNTDEIIAQAGHVESAASIVRAVVSTSPYPSTVNALLVATSKDILETEEYPLSPDAESAILDRLFEKYVPTKQIPHDEVSDGQK